MTLVAERPMAKDKDRKNTPVRIDDEALRLARIAASYKGMNLAEYVSAALLDAARRDIERGHAELAGEAAKKKGPEGGSPRR